MQKRSFASDNNAGIHPQVLEAISQVNQGHALAYGNDDYTKSVLEKFQKLFRRPIKAHFVFNGTSANVLGLSAITKPHHAIFCAETAHIQVDECGAPEMFTGCKLVDIPTVNGKLTVELIRPHLKGVGDQHHVQPRVISIAQSTELGTVYTRAEIKALADFAHENDMYLHMDGARIANAVALIGKPLRTFTQDVGVDILSFGGTKNGILAGEAVLFLNPKLAKDFLFVRKQGMQLASKMRFIAVQFDALLTKNLWIENATHANRMAKLLEKEIKSKTKIKITQPVDANAVFAIVPKTLIAKLQKKTFFYVWNDHTLEVRWMCSFDTVASDIHEFVKLIQDYSK
ncbi:MAG: low specificity L-threonine aldolase [Xanthomonadaceae bacterium]|nr:low specificity L-threonine aldolase [Xanthomonadaceae bacterium]